MRNYSIWSCGILPKGRDCAVQMPDEIPALQQSALSKKLPSIVRISGFLWHPCSVLSLIGFSLWKGQCFQSRQSFSTSHNLVSQSGCFHKNQTCGEWQVSLLNRNLSLTEEGTENCCRYQTSISRSPPTRRAEELTWHTGTHAGRPLNVKVTAIIKKINFFVTLSVITLHLTCIQETL